MSCARAGGSAGPGFSCLRADSPLGFGLPIALLLACAPVHRVRAAADEQEPPAASATDAAPILVESSRAPLQPRQVDGALVFDASQFERFAPKTALEMARQIPGFRLEEGNQDRGLGQASQNVLINGARVTGKNNDAVTALGQITATSVLRLELVDGASLDVPGLSGQVLNVVTLPDDFSGTFVWVPTFRERIDDNLLNFAVNTTGKLAGGDFTLGLDNSSSFRGGGWGEEVFRDAAGDRLFGREFLTSFHGDRPTLTGSWGRHFAGGGVLNTRAALKWDRFQEGTAYLRPVGETGQIIERQRGGSERWGLETGADYEFGLGAGRLKLIAFSNLETNDGNSLFRRDYNYGEASTGSRFDRTTDTSETVLRGEYRWRAASADWQFSLEGALNTLDSDGELAVLGPGGDFEVVPLPEAATRVEEHRGEAMLSWGRPLSELWTVQTSVGGEFSRLGTSGAESQDRTFWRPKGMVSLTYKATQNLDLSFRLERVVGQLDFYDFLASVDTQNDNDNASNPDLVPPQSWYAELQFVQRMGAFGSATLKLYGEHITDIVDRVPIGEDAEAPGNLEEATRYGAELTATLLFDGLGWQGGKLDVTGRLRRSELADPLTGLTRQISLDREHWLSLNLRHDVAGTDWAWGAGLEDMRETPFYRLDYRRTFETTKPITFAFIEYKDLAGMRLRFSAVNLTGQQEVRREWFYVERRDGPVEFTTERPLSFGTIYRLNLSGTF